MHRPSSARDSPTLRAEPAGAGNQPSLVAVNGQPGVTFTQLTARGFDTCGLGSDNQAYCWGANTYGELGDGATTDRSSPVAVNAPAGWPSPNTHGARTGFWHRKCD